MSKTKQIVAAAAFGLMLSIALSFVIPHEDIRFFTGVIIGAIATNICIAIYRS